MFVLSLASDAAKKVTISSDEQLIKRIQQYFPERPGIRLNSFVWECFPGNKSGYLLVYMENWIAAGMPVFINNATKFDLTIYDSNDVSESIVFNDLIVKSVHHIMAPLGLSGTEAVDYRRFLVVELGQSLGIVDEPKYFNLNSDWMPESIYLNSHVGANPVENTGPVFPDFFGNYIKPFPFPPLAVSNRDFITYCANLHCATAYVPRNSDVPVLTNAKRNVTNTIATQDKRILYTRFHNSSGNGRMHLAFRDKGEDYYEDHFESISLGDPASDTNFANNVVVQQENDNYTEYYPFYKVDTDLSYDDPIMTGIKSRIGLNSNSRCSTYYELIVQGLVDITLANNLRRIEYRLNRSHVETVLTNDPWKPYDIGITSSIASFKYDELVDFTMLSGWNSDREAVARIRRYRSDNTSPDEYIQKVWDRQGIFKALQGSWYGLALKLTTGKHVVIQAICRMTSSSSAPADEGCCNLLLDDGQTIAFKATEEECEQIGTEYVIVAEFEESTVDCNAKGCCKIGTGEPTYERMTKAECDAAGGLYIGETTSCEG